MVRAHLLGSIACMIVFALGTAQAGTAVYVGVELEGGSNVCVEAGDLSTPLATWLDSDRCGGGNDFMSPVDPPAAGRAYVEGITVGVSDSNGASIVCFRVDPETLVTDCREMLCELARLDECNHRTLP